MGPERGGGKALPPAGRDKPALHEGLSREERLARLWHVTVRAWAFVGGPIHRVPRREWPIETFEIDYGHEGTATLRQAPER